MRGLLDAVVPGTPVSVEVPNAHLRAAMSATDCTFRNRQAVGHLFALQAQRVASDA